MQKKVLFVFRKKGNSFHEGGAVAPNTPPQFRHWHMSKMMKVKGRNKALSHVYKKADSFSFIYHLTL